ncbi:hypothetical protein [Microbacterium sp. 77mftsu3.1]|uniref:hypothetical protein n=1 Tax=Microbacterium sp. 77mftsu3.1 TaxID=1761802 RepID=UPI00035C2A15|nr:hypothetical protein [Microbacterium sp. 77mftsu3.1]SDH40123.1 hypothetical protein SAMN04488590_3245 [Microbacterium sp. 77mftsu3.1]
MDFTLIAFAAVVATIIVISLAVSYVRSRQNYLVPDEEDHGAAAARSERSAAELARASAKWVDGRNNAGAP